MESFDDRKLINLARYNFYSHKIDDRPEGIEELFTKEKLSNSESNQLLAFLETSRHHKPLSMSEMKRQILSIIGFENAKNSWQNTVSRDELEAIYNYIKAGERK